MKDENIRKYLLINFSKSDYPFTKLFLKILLGNAFIFLILINHCIGQITIVKWSFPNLPDDAIADEGISNNLTQLISLSGERLCTFSNGSSSYAASANGWESGTASKFWQIELNTTGYTSLALSSKQRSSPTGPANFKLVYSIDDGLQWNDVPSGTITVGDNWNSGFINVNLPSECNNQSQLLIRWLMSSNISVDGGTVSGGTSRIDDVTISGCNILIDSFQPLTGPAGTNITIKGSNFSEVTSVSFNGIEASYTIENDHTITAKVPPMVSSGTISVTNSFCSSVSNASFQLLNTCPIENSNLIISELCDPFRDYATTRYIEIYNPTNKLIDLQGWSVRAISNGKDCFTWNLQGSIAPKQALTCGNNNPLNGGPHSFTDPNWNSAFQCCIGWNGERQDGAILYNGATVVDYVYNSPNNNDWFKDGVLVRNSDVCKPTIVTNLGEWKFSSAAYAGTAPSTPRTHYSDCNSSLPVIITQPVNQSVCENSTASFFLNINGTLPVIFQWKYLDDLTGIWQDVSGSNFVVTNTFNSSTLNIINVPQSFNHRQFYCEIRNNGEDCFVVSNAVSLIIEDKEPPLFSIPPSLIICVENIKTAVYNDSIEDFDPNRPDYYRFLPGNTQLDLDPLSFSDNCPLTCEFQIRWKITMSDGTIIPPTPTLFMSGQPSAHENEIRFRGDQECSNSLNHLITYWIVDCAGNISESLTRIITVNPRPDLKKN